MIDCWAATTLAGIQTPGAGRDLAEAEAAAVLPLPQIPDDAGSSGSGESVSGRLLVWAVGHRSSGVPEEWAAGPGRPGVALTELTPEGAQCIIARVRAAKRPGDMAIVSIHWGSNWGFGVSIEQRRFAHALIDGGEQGCLPGARKGVMPTAAQLHQLGCVCVARVLKADQLAPVALAACPPASLVGS